MIHKLRRYFVSGLLFWLPIWATFLVIKFLLNILNNTMLLLPHRYQPDALLGFHVPGIGVVITLLMIFSTGLLVANIIGRLLVNCWDSLIKHIPLVNTVYSNLKQICDTLFASNGNSFRKVLLVEYPRQGLWTIAFQTGEGPKEVATTLSQTDLISIFVPTTPNPTGGFLMMVPYSQVIELTMPVEQALKYVISLGVVKPL
jgi:uncharacterized membrane protein